MVSFDYAVKSNLSVGLPFDLQIHENDAVTTRRTKRTNADDEVYQAIASGWGEALRDTFQHLPSYKLSRANIIRLDRSPLCIQHVYKVEIV